MWNFSKVKSAMAVQVELDLAILVGIHNCWIFGDQLFEAGEASPSDRYLGDDPKPALNLT